MSHCDARYRSEEISPYTITQVDPLAIIIPEMADNRQTNQPKTNYNKWKQADLNQKENKFS